jgi:iron complex outermembrane receptor protein
VEQAQDRRESASIAPARAQLRRDHGGRPALRLAAGRYDASIYANNATDEKNIISQALLAARSGAGVTAYLGHSVNGNLPARYGVTFRAKFS